MNRMPEEIDVTPAAVKRHASFVGMVFAPDARRCAEVATSGDMSGAEVRGRLTPCPVAVSGLEAIGGGGNDAVVSEPLPDVPKCRAYNEPSYDGQEYDGKAQCQKH